MDRTQRRWGNWRTLWWGFTHPFTSYWKNPGVKQAMDTFEDATQRRMALRIADAVREGSAGSWHGDYWADKIEEWFVRGR